MAALFPRVAQDPASPHQFLSGPRPYCAPARRGGPLRPSRRSTASVLAYGWFPAIHDGLRAPLQLMPLCILVDCISGGVTTAGARTRGMASAAPGGSQFARRLISLESESRTGVRSRSPHSSRARPADKWRRDRSHRLCPVRTYRSTISLFRSGLERVCLRLSESNRRTFPRAHL